MSTTPIRAALKDLANEGLVEIRPNVGARVTELSLEELEEVYLVRIGIEPWLARLGAQELSEAELEEMELRLRDFEVAVSERDPDATLDGGWRVREICYKAASRTRVLENARTLFNRARRYNRITLMSSSRFDETSAGIHDFYEACRVGDGATASEVVREALQRSFEHIAQGLDDSVRDDRTWIAE